MGANDKLAATFHPHAGPTRTDLSHAVDLTDAIITSPGVRKQARDLCGRDVGRTVTATVRMYPEAALGLCKDIPFHGTLDTLKFDHLTVWIGSATGGTGWLDLDAEVTVTGTPVQP